MKKLLAILIGLFISINTYTQECLPDGIIFNTQAQIDSFQINYPNCTQIEGDVVISGSDITNLSGLSVINSIGGDLNIGTWDYNGNPLLTSLTGLEGVTNIEGNLEIRQNNLITSLTGLDNLNFLGKDFRILMNNSLNDLTGLGSLTIMEGGGISITYNDALTNLSGLENLVSTGYLDIGYNSSLTSLTGLNNLTAIVGDLVVDYNSNLSSLYGLMGLKSIGGYLDLTYNMDLTSLSGLDSLTNIAGKIKISYTALTSLKGLENLTSIGGGLGIYSNNSLHNLTGLGNLASIGAHLELMYNDSLTSLSGLENLTSIGWALFFKGNDALTSFTGLDNLVTIGNNIWIGQNNSLSSLAGLDNIEEGSINDLTIINNICLSTCAVESICEYLASPNGTIEIHDNAPGCNSQEEVDSACVYLSNGKAYIQSELSIYPNPSSNQITLETREIQHLNHLTVFNLNNQELIKRQITESKTVINISCLPNGVYFVKLTDESAVRVFKIVKN